MTKVTMTVNGKTVAKEVRGNTLMTEFLRGDIPALAAALQAPGARSVVIWRGKPLVRGEAQADLLRLPLDHPLLAEARARPVLLGLLEAMTAGYLSSQYKDAVAFLVILGVLFVMPQGIFGHKSTERV